MKWLAILGKWAAAHATWLVAGGATAAVGTAMVVAKKKSVGSKMAVRPKLAVPSSNVAKAVQSANVSDALKTAAKSNVFSVVNQMAKADAAKQNATIADVVKAVKKAPIFQVPRPKNILLPGDVVKTSYSPILTSANGRAQLHFQPEDGNLVLVDMNVPSSGGVAARYNGGTPYWEWGASGFGGTYAAMQSDGNFVIYDDAGNPVLRRGGSGRAATDTAGYPGAYLTLQDDGNLVVYSTARRPKVGSFPFGAVAARYAEFLQHADNQVAAAQATAFPLAVWASSTNGYALIDSGWLSDTLNDLSKAVKDGVDLLEKTASLIGVAASFVPGIGAVFGPVVAAAAKVAKTFSDVEHLAAQAGQLSLQLPAEAQQAANEAKATLQQMGINV